MGGHCRLSLSKLQGLSFLPTPSCSGFSFTRLRTQSCLLQQIPGFLSPRQANKIHVLWEPQGSACLRFSVLGLQTHTTYAYLFVMSILGIELRSVCLGGNHLMDWTISPVPYTQLFKASIQLYLSFRYMHKTVWVGLWEFHSIVSRY